MKKKLLTTKNLCILIIFLITVTVCELLSSIIYEKIVDDSAKYAVEIALQKTFVGYDQIDQKIKKPRLLPHPYTLFQLTPDYNDGNNFYTTNSMGYRDIEFVVEKKSGVKRILALGGSTTYGASVPRNENTWPSKLNELLKKNNFSYEVINGGVDSASSAEILSSWLFKHRFLKPDLVILNLGINDIWPILLTEKFEPNYTNFRQNQSYSRPTDYFQLILRNSSIVKILWSFFNKLNFFNADPVYPYIQVKDPDLSEQIKNGQVIKRAINRENIGFVRNFSYLIDILKMENIKVLIVVEPSMSLTDFENFTKDKNEYFMKGLEHPWIIIKEKNTIIMENIALMKKIPIYMIDSNKFELDWYSDWYHLNEKGEKKKADLIYNSLRNNNLIQ
jgi:lysophospholipase L1-like esterase